MYGRVNEVVKLLKFMGIFQKINNLFNQKQKIEKEIAILKKSCKHSKKC